MKLWCFIIISLAFPCSRLWSQTSFSRSIDTSKISWFVDSLKQAMFDSVHFYGAKHYNTHAKELWKQEGYYILTSPLIIVNDKFYYFFDTPDSLKLLEFSSEFLKPQIISHINLIDTPFSYHLYGPKGLNKAVAITIKKGQKFNPEVAGLKIIGKGKKRRGDNFF